MALGLFSTVAAMIAPCSVNTMGNERLPPLPGFDIAFCDVKASNSPAVRRKAKSAGKRA